MRTKEKIIKVPFIGDLIYSSGHTIVGILLGIFTGGLLIAISGVNPFLAYASMFRGAFNSLQSFSNVLVRSSPLLLGGIGVAIGIKSGVWNTGIEGYMYIGAIGATIVAIPELGLPPIIHILLCFIVAMLFAGLWGAIPGYLRAYKGVNEVTATIMLSYVAIYFTNWIVSGSPLAQEGAYFPMSLPFAKSSLLSILMKGTSLHPGPFIGLLMCIIFHIILKYTPFGFRTRMLGHNPFAAQYAGINSKKQIVITMVIGAMLGGLGGAIEVLGLKHRLYMEFVTGVGYESVAVALVAGGEPIGVMLSALFFSILKVGGATMSIETGVSSSMASIIIALCVLFVIGVGVADSKRLKKRDEKDPGKKTLSFKMEEAVK
ncbi:MAG: ABC transporter permease [Spirochaetae bacterium HGW-Spirochaetae-2]|jgi:simple sugar transport system permease protein|nr:MAG: ABC transporter permease [Spirochaetae bacterium HGW-Spirochaetae-2]